MKKKKVRRKHKKYRSKYYMTYGYSIRDVMMWLGWSYGTVHAYFQDPFKRKEMLDLVKLEESCK